jgi:hypothetical protein
MSQGWNRQFQNMQRLIDEYAKMINLKDQGFQLGESSDLRRPGNFNLGEAGPMKTGKTVPTVYQQPRVQPQAALPGRNTMPLPASQKPLLLTTSGKPLPNQSSIVNLGGDAGQVAYRLPNGTYTSNKDLFNLAKQQTAKAQLMRDARSLAKGAKVGGITAALSVPAAVLTHRKAIDYYNSILNDPNSTPEQKQLAMAMRTKEYIQMGTEGLGSVAGTAIGTMVTKHPKIGATVGGALPYALSSGFGHYFDKAFTPAMQQYGFQPYNSSLVNEVGAMVGRPGNNNKGKSSGDNGNTTGNSTGTNGVRSGSRISGQPTTQAQALALAQQLGGKPPVANKQDAGTQQANTNAINDYISKLQEINQPYIEALQKFADNYDDLYNQNQLYNRRMRDLSAITGSPLWYQSAKDYNPLVAEANRINTLKTIQDAQAGDINAINEVMGNLALAKELNLPPEAAFANKNLLTALTANRRQLTDLEKAQIMADIRRYGYDSAFARALQVQSMKGQNALDVARTYMGGGVAPGLNRQGGVQTPYQPLANKQQGGSNLQQAFDMYANK